MHLFGNCTEKRNYIMLNDFCLSSEIKMSDDDQRNHLISDTLISDISTLLLRN